MPFWKNALGYAIVRRMKLWIKFLLGALIGIACALILPAGNAAVENAARFIAELAARFARYITVPLMFFTAITAFNKLRETRMFLKAGSWTVLTIAASSLLLTSAGLLSILLVRLPRIPIFENVEAPVSLNVPELFRALLPYSAFSSLANGTFLLVPFGFALLIGAESTADQAAFRPILQLANALSKLMYNIGALFSELLSLGMAAFSAYWIIQYRKTAAGSVYAPLFILLFVDLIIVAGIIYPLIIRSLCHDPHPYRILYAAICPLAAAFFSGDSNLTLLLNMRHGKESLGIRRRINGAVHPLFTVFARGGSALVTAVCFIAIRRSYSVLNIPLSDILWILATAFGISFLLGGYPVCGAFVSLNVLCVLYGKGFSNGFTLLAPAAPILCAFAAAFDALTAVFGSYIIAVKTKLIEHHGISHFI